MRRFFSGSLTLEVTNACNFACPYCGTGAGKPLPGELSKEEIFSLLDQLRPDGTVVSGGEPLTRDDIFEIVDHAGRYGPVRLNTNGALLSREAAERLSAEQVHISVHAGPDGGFGTVEKALDALKAAGKLDRARLCVTLSKDDPGAPVRIIRHFSPRVRKFGIGRLAPIGRAEADKVPSRLDAFRAYLRLLPLRPRNDIMFFGEFGGAFAIVARELTVTADGGIIPCCLVREPEGNVRSAGELPWLPRFCFFLFSGCADCRRIRR